MTREQRKNEHIEQYLRTEYAGNTLLSNVIVEPTSLPELALSQIDTTQNFCGQKTGFPLMINAMTGGTEMTEEINQDLAMLAEEFGLAMQVGSQRIALENPEAVSSFRVVRHVLKRAPVIANLGARASVDEVRQAMEMLEADAIGLHLNASQELAMEEGDRDFRGVVDHLQKLNEAFPGKIIVKEVGFGMNASVGRTLREIGISMVDVSGAGGTNFIEIENLRSQTDDYGEFYDWGIPTALSILHVRRSHPEAFLIASGGIRTATDILKAMVLGADYTAMSGELLRFLLMGSYEYARDFLARLMEHTKKGMLLLGCQNLTQLHKVPYTMTGVLKERWQHAERSQ